MTRRLTSGLAATAVGVLCALTLPAAGGPDEANLYHHLKDAFKNPPPAEGLPRVLLIGDSISIGYTIPVRKELAGKAAVFRPPVNCQHTGYGLAHLEAWLGTGRWDVIHFNWGIWDTHLLDAKGNLVRSAAEESAGTNVHVRYTPGQYRDNLNRLVDRLQKTGAAMVWASSTPVLCRTGDRLKAIGAYNAVAEEVMKARGVEIDDLHAFVLSHTGEWQSADRVHFNDLGNQMLGRQVAGSIERAGRFPK